MRIVPELDESGRHVVANDWSITLRTYISATSTTAPEVNAAVERLSHNGKVFVYTGRGVGPISINTGQVKDLKYGPHVGPIELNMIGSDRAVELTWTVRTKLPNCAAARFEFAISDFEFTVTHQIDDAGFTTRTLTGSLTVPARETANGSNADSADRYRRAIRPAKLPGFKRTWGDFVLSADRSRLDWSVIDREAGGEPYPIGVVEPSLSTNTTSTGAGLQQWQTTFAGQYRMASGFTGWTAARAFFTAVITRIKQAQTGLAKVGAGDSNFIPETYSQGEPNRYDRPVFTFNLTVRSTHSLTALLRGFGAYEPLKANTWQQWMSSVDDTSFDPYGALKLVFGIGDDTYAGLCKTTQNPQQVMGSLTQRFGRAAGPYPDIPSASQIFSGPSPANSWLHYEQEIWVELDSGVVPLRTLPGLPISAAEDVLSSRVPDVGGSQMWDVFRSQVMPPSIEQPGAFLRNISVGGFIRRVPTACRIHLTGFAMRAGFDCPVPRLIDVNGIPAIPDMTWNQGYGFRKGVSYKSAVPIHYTKWNTRYYLTDVPEGPLPPIPMPIFSVGNSTTPGG
jgi:hypothetical protein